MILLYIRNVSISQTQKEDLDRALRAAAERGTTDEEHARMKEELSALPSLKEELEALKARVSELSQLTGTTQLFSNFFSFPNLLTCLT